MSHFLISTNLCGVRVGRGAVPVDGEAAEDPAAVEAGDRAAVGAARGVLRVGEVSRGGTAAACIMRDIDKNDWELETWCMVIGRVGNGIALAKQYWVIAKWIEHATVGLDLS